MCFHLYQVVNNNNKKDKSTCKPFLNMFYGPGKLTSSVTRIITHPYLTRDFTVCLTVFHRFEVVSVIRN